MPDLTEAERLDEIAGNEGERVPPEEEGGIVRSRIVDGLGDQFGPLLQEASGGRLGPIGWFRADWQRSGAKTGRAEWLLDDGEVNQVLKRSVGGAGKARVVVKIPVGPVEYLWNERMQADGEDAHGITAMTFASGKTLGGYDFAWIVMERFGSGPLFGVKRKDAVDLAADAAARFYRRAVRYSVDEAKRLEDWPALLERARESCRSEMLPKSQSWHSAIKKLQKHGQGWIREWKERPITGWIHGDLHPANVMSRSDDPEDPAMLIDLAAVRPGHWIEDAVYLERIYWARRSLIDGHDPVSLIGKARKRYGLAGLSGDEGDIQRLSRIRRALLAATAPAYLKSEGSPRYLSACLSVLEDMLKKL